MRTRVLALLTLGLCLGQARAQETSTQARNGGLATLFPNVLEEQRVADWALASELERSLELLDGVEQARVQLVRADVAAVPLDQPVPAPKLTVTLRTAGEGPNQAALDAALNALAPLRPSLQVDVQRVSRPVAATVNRPTQRETNGSPFRPLLALSLGANVLLATLLLLRVRRPRLDGQKFS